MKLHRIILFIILVLSCLCKPLISVFAYPIDFKDVNTSDRKAVEEFWEHCNDDNGDEYKNAAIRFVNKGVYSAFGCFSEPIELTFLQTSKWFNIAYMDPDSVTNPEFKIVCVINDNNQQATLCSDIDSKIELQDSNQETYPFDILNNIIDRENLSINADNVIDYLKDVYNIWNANIYGGVFYTNVEQKSVIKELYCLSSA